MGEGTTSIRRVIGGASNSSVPSGGGGEGVNYAGATPGERKADGERERHVG